MGSDACNGVSRKMTVVGDTVKLGENFGAHTAMACAGPLPTLLQRFFASDELRLATGTAVLTYRALDTTFGPTSSLIVDHGESGAQSYRLVWENGGLSFQTVDTSTGAGGRGGAGVGAEPGKINAMRSAVDGKAYLFGIIPATAARVVYEPTGGAPEELAIHDVRDDRYAAIGQFVDASPAKWQVVAYDSAGTELDRLRWG